MATVAISVRGISKRYTRGTTAGWSLQAGLRTAYRAMRGRPIRGGGRARDTFWALDDVTFEIARGERVGIIGRNGAGKSTLLKVLSRVVFPTRGEATIRGRLTSLLEVGTGFNENLTGRENVYLNASIHGLSRAEIADRFDDIVDFAGVRPFLDTPVKRYSSGMQMRLAFAVAAHLDPDILLLDEVLAVGDLSFQQKCLERVEGLVSEGRTLVFVSHSLDAIARFCTRCLWLDGGRLREDGPADRVLDAYLEEIAGIRASRSFAAGPPPLAVPGGGVSPIAAKPAGPSTGDAASGSSETSDAVSQRQEGGAEASAVPGDDIARLVEVRLVGVDGGPRSSVAVGESIGIEVTFDILQHGPNVQPAIYFKSATDQYLFVVAYTDPDWLHVPPALGRHVTTVWVPPHLLNVGISHVTIALATPDPFEVHCTVERAVSFNVYERFGDTGTARGLYSREFPGAVRPRLRWETRRSVGVDQDAAVGAAAPWT
jgi:lipopolysaccharide transport system ATP-binding protein